MSQNDRQTTKSVKLTPHAHSRVKTHKRSGETMSGCIERMADALELVDDLPEAVTRALEESGE